MAVRKIAISLPEDVLKEVDRLAKKSKTTRSALISKVLKEVSHASTQREITARINRLFEDPKIKEEQSDTARTFLMSPKKEYGDSDW
jgi:metal-responsive CopG/Arc/MetJ family transcriptional regulator